MLFEITRARVAAGILLAAFLIAGSAPALAAPIKHIVLVHGAWVDGSGWKPVDEILARDGYQVSVVQEPLTSLQDDVAATKRILHLQPGPCILVAHSYGGTVITEAGTDPHVIGARLYRGAAVGLLALLRNEGGSVGTSVAQIIQQRREQFHNLRLNESLDPLN
jgi:pimeloyl-ACP methyl ester carboxylesterase